MTTLRGIGAPMAIEALLALVVGTAALLPAQVPAQRKETDTIAYQHSKERGLSFIGPNLDVYSVNADGSDNTALTNDGHSHTPSWSPDGQHILFVHDGSLQTPPSYRDPEPGHHPIELFEMDRAGRNPQLMRRFEPWIDSAALSPDGKTLAIAYSYFSAEAFGGVDTGLFLLPGDGQGTPRLLRARAYSPAWSPDGKRIAFRVNPSRTSSEIHILNMDGSNDVRLDGGEVGSPAWSPDGNRIAFVNTSDRGVNQIYVMDADGSGVHQMTGDPDWSGCQHPSWSPNGSRLAFDCVETAYQSENPCLGLGPYEGNGSQLKWPICANKIFVVSADNPPSKLTPLIDNEGAFPVFAPR